MKNNSFKKDLYDLVIVLLAMFTTIIVGCVGLCVGINILRWFWL